MLTVLGNERPGLVAALSEVLVRHEGNWLESQLSTLAGKFAGVAVVEVPRAQADAFRAALPGLATSVNLQVNATSGDQFEEDPDEVVRTLTVVGQDRPGIVAEISAALASWGVTIRHLITFAEETPMADGVVFTANLIISIPPEVDEHDVEAVIEGLSSDLMVEFDDLGDVDDLLFGDEADDDSFAAMMQQMLEGMGLSSFPEDEDEDDEDDADPEDDEDEEAPETPER